MVIITFGIGALPPFGGDITPLGMDVLGVFLGVLYGWTFLGFFWTSCFGLLALGILDNYRCPDRRLQQHGGFAGAGAVYAGLLFD